MVQKSKGRAADKIPDMRAISNHRCDKLDELPFGGSKLKIQAISLWHVIWFEKGYSTERDVHVGNIGVRHSPAYTHYISLSDTARLLI